MHARTHRLSQPPCKRYRIYGIDRTRCGPRRTGGAFYESANARPRLPSLADDLATLRDDFGTGILVSRARAFRRTRHNVSTRDVSSDEPEDADVWCRSRSCARVKFSDADRPHDFAARCCRSTTPSYSRSPTNPHEGFSIFPDGYRRVVFRDSDTARYVVTTRTR